MILEDSGFGLKLLGIVFRYPRAGTGTGHCVPVPVVGYRNRGGGTGTQTRFLPRNARFGGFK